MGTGSPAGELLGVVHSLSPAALEAAHLFEQAPTAQAAVLCALQDFAKADAALQKLAEKPLRRRSKRR